MRQHWLSRAGRAAHVRVGNVVEEVVQEAVGAVHGAERAAQPVPLARRKVRQRRVPARWRQDLGNLQYINPRYRLPSLIFWPLVCSGLGLGSCDQNA